MLWERRWLILIVTAATTALAIATRPQAPAPLYRATATLEIRTITFSSSGQTSVSSISGVPPREVQAARSAEVAAETARELGRTDGGLDLLSRLVVVPVEGTDLLQLSLTGRGAATVTELDTYAENYVGFRKQFDQQQINNALKAVDDRIAALEPRLRTLSQRLAAERRAANGQASDLTIAQFTALSQQYTQLAGLRERIEIDAQFAGGTVRVVGSPLVQKLGALPTRTIRTLAGPIVGLLLGAALALGVGVLRPRIGSRERAEDRLGYAVLASIPHVRGVQRDPLRVQRRSAWGAEGIRMLLTEMGLLKRGKKLRVVVVASPEPHDGRTTIALNLAASYAASGRSVALFRADGVLPPPNPRGAESVGQRKTADVRMHREGFAEVFSGQVRGEHLGNGEARKGVLEIVSELAREFDIVVVDTRPILMSADAVALAAEADSVLIVLRHLKTMEGKAASAIEILERHNAPIVGLVLNDRRLRGIERYRSSRAGRPERIVSAAPQKPRRAPARARQQTVPAKAEPAHRHEESPVPLGEHEAITNPESEVPATVRTAPSEGERPGIF